MAIFQLVLFGCWFAAALACGVLLWRAWERWQRRRASR